MARLETTFNRLAQEGQKALVTYLTIGDPDMATSLSVVKALCRAGADVLELGVPFSDPTADGPVIQASSGRALAAGTTVAGVLELVRALRLEHDTPAILFGYYNPFLQYGLARLVADAADAGVDGFLVVDLPPEEASELHALCVARGLNLIYLLTPTSDAARIEAVRAVAGGFVYYVSRTGVTGAAVTDLAGVNAQVEKLKGELGLPVCVGFGIAEPAQVAALGEAADGVVVGSAIVKRVEALGAGETDLAAIEAYVRSLKAPLRRIVSPLPGGGEGA